MDEKKSIFSFGKKEAVPNEKKTILPVEKKEEVPTEKKSIVPVEKKESALNDKKESTPGERKEIIPVEKKEAVPTEKKEAAPSEKKEAVKDEKKEAIPADKKESIASQAKDKETKKEIIAKCPFMGGKDCLGESCALWVELCVTRSDFTVLRNGSKWMNRVYTMPGHCKLNDDQARKRLVVHEEIREAQEEESAPDICESSIEKEQKVEMRNSVYLS